MGWSIHTVGIPLDNIFRSAARSYRITHVQSAAQAVVVEYSAENSEDELPVRFKQRIVEQFPDFVYVDFVAVPVSAAVRSQQHWDLEATASPLAAGAK